MQHSSQSILYHGLDRHLTSSHTVTTLKTVLFLAHPVYIRNIYNGLSLFSVIYCLCATMVKNCVEIGRYIGVSIHKQVSTVK